MTELSFTMVREIFKLTNGVTFDDPFFEPRELFSDFIGRQLPVEGSFA